MLVYSDRITPRLSYSCEVLLGRLVKDWQLTSDLNEFSNFLGPRICYDENFEIQGKCINIKPLSLLNEVDMRPIIPEIGTWKNLPALFPNSGVEISFDILSATFFLVSRYEEYQSTEKDYMGRFKAGASFASRNGFLSRPLIDEWRIALGEEIKRQWPEALLIENRFNFVSTIDVDSAFAFKHKGFMRTALGFAKDMVHLNLSNLKSRARFVFSGESDPYDSYQYISSQHELNRAEAIFFFLLADHAEFDKPVSYKRVRLQRVIKTMAVRNTIGIHPGVASNIDKDKLRKEISRLEFIVGKKVNTSRQHYLKLIFPHTYRQLAANGIADDYTMGYASRPGFRASTCFPFRWFDLEKNEITNLVIHPFAVMDSTLNYYMKLKPDKAIEEIKKIQEAVRKVNGIFISIWHNESFCETDVWRGWRRVFEEMLFAANRMHKISE